MEERRRKEDRGANDEKIRILAVDDDRTYLAYLRHVLSGAGFDVETAKDGTAAIARMHEQPVIDMLLVDLTMPSIDGIETVRRIRAESCVPGLYTILLTAHDGSAIRLSALDSGLDDFLTKMTPEPEIIAILRSAARRLEMERRLHLENEELQTLALTDELTGVANRRALFREAEAILGAGRPLSVVLFDLDHFKEINDTHGHIAGDGILADVAACLKANTRVGDVIARYGGDEFVLLLPDTELDEARVLADRIAQRVRQTEWTVRDTRIDVSVTYGLGFGATPRLNVAAILADCDAQLYRQKGRGKKEALPRFGAISTHG